MLNLDEACCQLFVAAIGSRQTYTPGGNLWDGHGWKEEAGRVRAFGAKQKQIRRVKESDKENRKDSESVVQ
jgi:hypothetical protein